MEKTCYIRSTKKTDGDDPPATMQEITIADTLGMTEESVQAPMTTDLRRPAEFFVNYSNFDDANEWLFDSAPRQREDLHW